MVKTMASTRFTAFLLLCTFYEAHSKGSHFATIPSSHDHRKIITSLANKEFTEYQRSTFNNDFESNDIAVTRDGKVFSYSPLQSFAGRNLTVGINSRHTVTGVTVQQKLILQILNDNQNPTVKSKDYQSLHRYRRAAEVSIAKTVPENVTEISLDYSLVGVIVSSDNRFYLRAGHGAPFTGANLYTGRLIVDSSRRLDYETAPSKQYQLMVIVNNSRSSNEYEVSVTITLLDVNDELPVFLMEPFPYLAIFDANLPPNSKVNYNVLVSDPDATSQLVYSLMEDNTKFRITQSGELFTTERLVQGSEYVVRVRVEDVNGEQFTQTATAEISIFAGRRPPQFYKSRYETSIPENVQGTELDVVVKVKSFQGEAVSFSIPESQVFTIEKSANRHNEARIRTISRLNYETDPRSFTLVITATERGTGLSSTAVLFVTLQDINDNSPIFDISEYVDDRVFPEDVQEGTVITTVRATDRDPETSANGQITYSLQAVSGALLPFTVQTNFDGDVYEGIIKVSGNLDYETIDKTGYRFKVIAADNGTPSKNDSAFVRVRVRNTNDEAPRFPSIRLERIEATKSVDSVVSTVQASDPDGDKVTYAIVSSQPDRSPFTIESTTGSIYLRESLAQAPHADRSSFTLNISATDDGTCCTPALGTSNIGYVMVIIEIVGRNHAPEFPNCAGYSDQAKAPENTDNAFVIQVNARDQDVGPNGEIRYSLIVGDGTFRINPETGEIRTKSSDINREVTDQITLTVKAEDGAQSKLSSFCTFTMMVQDLNDNYPSLNLPSSQGAGLNSPNGTNIYTVFGVDPDFGVNGTLGLVYRVEENALFWIDGQTLRNTRKLTSSMAQTQTMMIVVTDGGGKETRVPFTVNIRQTASLPKFTLVPPLDFSILENVTDDTIITKIKAESATGGAVNYYLVPTTTLDAFYIRTDDQQCNDANELCLAIYQSRKLDADELRFYKLRVRVTPKALGSNAVSERTIDIQLIDVNDNIPVFENIDDNGYIMGSVDENTTVINRQVVVLKANDSDITPAFKTETYSLEPGPNSDLFSVEPRTGIVTVSQDVIFDRENISHYLLTVKATDGAPSARPQSGGLPNSKIAIVQINVNDINDNAPFFPQAQYSARVEETAPNGKLVKNIRASDLDIENNFKYILLSGNKNQAFEMNDNGDILVFNSARLDYETDKTYNMVVEVTDGRFQAQTNVHIALIDMNDNAPEFTERVYAVRNVTEEDASISPSNRLHIVTVLAIDADVDRPNNIRYYLSGSYSDRFQINSITGQVYLVSPLDRDSQPQWDINVLAHDEYGQPTNRIGYAIISVFPIDINDNYPVFMEDTLTATLPENGEIDVNVMTVRADDIDQDKNGAVKYKMKQGSLQPANFPDSQFYPYFTIDENGAVTSRAVFDRETVDKYTFEVIAYDEGEPEAKSATATATVIIGDVNDNQPEFVPNVYQKEVSELIGPSSFIVKVNARDVDSDHVFAFTLDEQAFKNFSIDSRGNIYLRDQQRLDFEHFYESNKTAEMDITVTVNDGKFSDRAQVKIIVVDENDETPVFEQPSVTVRLREDIPVNEVVAVFKATDRDAKSTPENSAISYFIGRSLGSDPDRYFNIDMKSGEVRTHRLLDRETISSHRVIILANDGGLPTQRTGTATLFVNLEDINDNGPRLIDPVVYIEENMPVDSYTRPRMIKAVDEDDNTVGHGPPFRMVAVNASQDLRFIFHEDWDVPPGLEVANGAGEIRTKRILDREGIQGPEIAFYLQLFDKQDVNDIRLLTVVVADEDDNPPSPGHRDALIYNYEGDYKVVEIGDCYAEDPDDWDKPYKTYEKVGQWNDGFSIDGDTGMISADLRILPSAVYNFRCKVIDNYIKDTTCAFNCNVANSTATQRKLCIDKCRVIGEAISTVTATIKTMEEGPVFGGASIRLKGTALDFLQPNAQGRSPYDSFVTRMANSLGTAEAFVDVFSVLDAETAPGYVDVRFTAHGSPYYNSTRLIAAVLDDDGLGQALGMKVAQVPVNECLKEVCDSGCTNGLTIGAEPTLVNANGSSLVGVTSVVKADCRCNIDDGSSPLLCTPESCLNGGLCVYNKNSQTTSCECPRLFDGPRCQQLRHSFTGDGWAQYKTLSQCGNGTTSFEIITTMSDGIILYNGPDKDPGSGLDAVTDYLAIGVSNGRPVVYVNYGTGYVKLTVNGNVNDGAWHKFELSKSDRRVTLVLDDCELAQIPDTDTSDVGNSRDTCQDTQQIPGENRFLNVATLLELGGRAGSSPWWPSEVDISTRKPYDGCIRNLKHNGELYDLNIGLVGRSLRSQDGCPRVDDKCLDSNGSPLCGVNGICEAFLSGPNVRSCTCKPGWRGDGCNTESESMDFSPGSFVEWELASLCQDATQCMEESYKTNIQLSFRSRDNDNNGLLFYASGSDDGEYIKLSIVDGKLQLSYNIGSDSKDHTAEEQSVTLPVTVTDGGFHTVRVTRVGKRFILQMDGGEGRYYAQHEDLYSHQLFITDGGFFSGADGSYMSGGSNITMNTDLENSCVVDVRFNGKWFPSNDEENTKATDVRMVRRENVADGCASDGCASVNCRGLQECKDLWRDFDCRCPRGFVTLYADPFCEDVDECFPDSPCANGDCLNIDGGFRCNCTENPETGMLYTGELCNIQASRSTLGLATSGIAALVVSVLLVLLIAVGIFCYLTRRSSIRKGEVLIDPYNDIRETIYNYDEEGMPEEDQDGYDISRLSKPIHPHIQPITDKPLSTAAPPHHDQPDVGDFINGRLNDADGDPTNCPGDDLKDYAYEGSGSDAGSLSSLNTSSSGGDQDFDYLNDWGPKFTRLADMYAGGDDI